MKPEEQNAEVQKKTWETPYFNIISNDIQAVITPDTKEFDDGLGHLYSS